MRLPMVRRARLDHMIQRPAKAVKLTVDVTVRSVVSVYGRIREFKCYTLSLH